jgi:phospholipase/carboxylesterase
MTVTRHFDLALQYVLNVPSGNDAGVEMPLVLMLHGRGADANDLAGLAPGLDAGGYRFVFPNAPRPFEPSPGMSFGFSWFDGWPPSADTFDYSRKLVLRLLDQLTDRYPTPPGKVIVSGFSQGGMLALDVAYRTRQDVAGVVVMSGALNENELPPFASKKTIPVLIVHGSSDDMIPILAARRMRHGLEHHGLVPEYHEFSMGHEVTPKSVAVVREFLQRSLTDEPPPDELPDLSL